MLVLQWGGAFAIAAIAVWIVAYIVVRWHQGHASVSWPHTAGHVLFALVFPVHSISRPYGLVVYYEHTVNGRRHQGHEVPWGSLGTYLDREEAEDARRAYPHHAPVTVYYDPRHPSLSTLHPGWHGGPALLFAGVVLGLAFAAVSLLLLPIPLPPSVAHPFQPHVPPPVPHTTPQQERFASCKAVTYLVWLATIGALAIWAHRRKHRYHPAIPTAIVSLVFGALEVGGYVYGVFALSAGHMLLGVALWLAVTMGAAYAFRAYARRAQSIVERNAQHGTGQDGGTSPPATPADAVQSR